MSTATVTPAATPAATPAVTDKGKGKRTPETTRNVNHGTQANLDAAVAELRKRYEAADKGETEARARFEAADIDWQNTRVIKVRVAYAAAMLTPNKGEANLLAATRYLLTDPADTPAKRTAQAKSRKNTLRNYVAAGVELQAKGLANRITEPDEEERKIVAAVFREMNKRDKDEAKGKGEGEGGEGEGEGGESAESADNVALSVADIVVKVAELNKVFNLIKSGGIVISEADAEQVQEMLFTFANELTMYSADK